jgi:CheY-like chemotaxis protein
MPELGNPVLVIHERHGIWVRHLRPRLADQPIRVVETRSREDLATVLAGGSGVCPIVLIDLARRPRAGLEDLDLARRLAPDSLILLLDPEALEGVALLARELGATDVVTGAATPPQLLRIVTRWLPLSRLRCESAGWSGSATEPPEPEPWNWLTPYFKAISAGA